MDTALLADIAHHRKLAQGDTVASGTGECFIVISGRMQASGNAGEDVFRTGDAFALRGFFAPTDHGATYTALEDTVLFVIADQTFDALAQAHPRVLYALLQAAYAPDAAAAPPAASIDKAALRSTLQRRLDAAPTRPKTVQTPAAPQPPAAPSPPAAPLAPPSPTRPSPGADAFALYPAGHKRYGITHSEYTKFLYPKNFTCPQCGKPFQGQKIFLSKLFSSAPVRFDLRESYQDFNMAWYDVICCPHCYFSAFISTFAEPKHFNRTRLKDVLPRAKAAASLAFAQERDIDFVFTAHYLALVCTDAFLHHMHLKARLWANLSWLYEDAGDEEMMRFAARQCADANEALYTAGNASPAQEQTLCLMLAAMRYRAGEKDSLRKWLYIAKTARGGKRTYADLAGNLLDVIREEKNPT